jgi:ketosteroid isomerase-like protein
MAYVDVTQEVLQAAEDRAAALAASDAERLRGLLHERFRWTTHTGEALDRATYLRRNTEGPTQWRSQTLAEIHVAVVGDTAVLQAEATDVVSGEHGEPQVFRMPMTQVWVRGEAGWQCLAGHAGPRRDDD